MEKIISTRVDGAVFAQMKENREINWSEVLRRAIFSKLENLNKEQEKKRKRKIWAAKMMEEIASRHPARGKSSTEIIREWRDKRK